MKKKNRKPSRHTLLLNKRMMDRLLLPSFVLGLLLGLIWWWSNFMDTTIIENGNNAWIAVSAFVALSFTLLAFVTRRMAYVQAYNTHLRIVTPFLRLNISYKRIRNTHPADFHQLFPANRASWAQTRFLAPFYGMTAVIVEMHSFPISPKLLRLFLPSQMFSKNAEGLVLLVPEWMKLSTDIDTYRGVWLQKQGRGHRYSFSYA
jgi:hypothetical protein